MWVCHTGEIMGKFRERFVFFPTFFVGNGKIWEKSQKNPEIFL